ncbi:MAG: DoxX family membrane protein [Bacteroidota bacterium]
MNRTVGVFILRSVLGFIFLMQGYGKVFSWGLENVYKNVFASYEALLPRFVLNFALYYTSLTELLGGLLLILGLFRYWAAYALGLVLIIVSFGHGLSEPIWNLSHVFPRTILLVAFLLLPYEWDNWSIDRLIFKTI